MARKSDSSQEVEDKISQNIQESTQLNNIENSENNENPGNKSLNDNSLKQVQLNDFNEVKTIKENNSLELLKDVLLKVVVELGRTVLKISDLMELGIGSIIELNKLYGDPVDIYVNNKLIGRGEVVVIDEDFAVRITEIITNPDIRK